MSNDKNFKLQLEFVSENPDGSANYRLDYSDDVRDLLIERGVIAILQDYIKQEEERPKSRQEKRLKALLAEDRK